MEYNFDQVIDRSNTNSYKWDQSENLFGRKDILPMWVADMDFQAPPEVVQALTESAEHGIYGYTFRNDGYYASIMDWQKKRHGWEIKKDWITSSPGVVTALSLSVDQFTERGDKVILQAPVYYPFYHVIEMNDREVINNPLLLKDNYYTIDFALLEEQAADPKVKMLLLCNPHNPGGRVWKKQELIKLGDICLKHQVLVVSDEIHEDLIFPGYQHIPFASLSEEFAQNSITCTAPSKTFNLAGLQSSIVIIPNKKLRQHYNHKLKAISIHMEGYFGAVATETAYRYGEPWLEAMMTYIQGNLEVVTNFISSQIPEIKVMKPEGTYLVWLDFREIAMDAKTLKEFMYEYAKVAMNEGSIFGKEGEGFLRMNIACPRSIIEQGLAQLKEGIQLFKLQVK